MSQEYTPVAWVDETTSQQGTLINAERLDQMQTAHHYADGFEEVDAIPTEDPGVDYHKVVYCTADSTFYRWDGTQWTADIDEDTKHLLDQEIARATQAEGELAQDIEDEATARAQADTALGARIDAETEAREAVDRQISEQIGSLNGETLPLYRSSSTPTIQNAIAANEGKISNLTSVVEGLEATKADSDNVVNSINGLKGTVALYPANIPMGPGQATLQQRLDVDLDLINANTDAIDQEISDRAAAIAALQASVYTKTEADTLLASKLGILSTTGLHAYTHNGATQSEIAVIDGTTASTIPIRGSDGRLQAADPASGATDKTLVTANWISQTGDNGPNNVLHKYGNETRYGRLDFADELTVSGTFAYNTKYCSFVEATGKYAKVGDINPGSLGGCLIGLLWSTKGHSNTYRNRYGIFLIRSRGTTGQDIIWMLKGSAILPEQIALTYDGTKAELWILSSADISNECLSFSLLQQANAGSPQSKIFVTEPNNIGKTREELQAYQICAFSD